MKFFKLIRHFFSLLILLTLVSCTENEPLPIVEFTISKTNFEVDEEIKFSNSTLNATKYSWDFGDGNTSTEINPTHKYLLEGSFRVTLYANGPGGESSFSQTISVTFPKPTADFIIQSSVLQPGEAIFFKNFSKNASSYSWDFGDGNTSADTDPSHIYPNSGTYQLKLTAKGKGGENSISKSILIANPILNGLTTAKFNPAIEYGTMTDQDGNVYKTVKIGSLTWMAENLRTTKYIDGTPILKITDNVQWMNATVGAYCNYQNTNTDVEIATYGRLYNWYSVTSGKLAPEGWRVPSEEDWQDLFRLIGGEDLAGGYLKEADYSHWNYPNTRATNGTGFTALPGGERLSNGAYQRKGTDGNWWSSTFKETSFYWHIFSNGGSIFRYPSSSGNVGYSVRLVKD